jgi:arylsulfatase A-like enzyme
MNEYGINDKTIVVIHSDHGEGFDHGKVLYHSSNIYNSALRVALIIKDPLNRVPKEINLPVTLTNIFSFLINLTNSKYKYTEIINNNKNIYYSTDQSPPYVSCSNKITKPANKYATVDFPYKLIYHLNENNPQENDFELYNLYNDPKEEKDIKMTETKILNNLKSKLLSFITRHQKQVNSTESNQNVSNTLKSLGY